MPRLVESQQGPPARALVSCLTVCLPSIKQELRRVFAFVDEPWEPQVLRFYDFPHDVGLEDGRVLGTRGYSISEGHYREWPADFVEEALKLAATTLHLLAYSTH